MKVLDITKKIQIVSKASLQSSMKELSGNRGLVCLGVTCIDLLNVANLRKTIGVDGARYLLIYLFNNFDNKERDFVGLPLKTGETIDSYAHLWQSLTYFENDIEKNFGIKIYRNERIRKEFIPIATEEYILNKDYDKNRRNVSENKDTCLELSSFSDFNSVDVTELITDSKYLHFDIVSENLAIESVRVKSTQVESNLEKAIEEHSLDEILPLLQRTSPKSWINIQLLWRETLDHFLGHKATRFETSYRMLIHEIATVMENLNSLKEFFVVLNDTPISKRVSCVIDSFTKLLFDLCDEGEEINLFKFREKLSYEWRNKCLEAVKNAIEDLEIIKSNTVQSPRLVKNFHLQRVKKSFLSNGFTGVPLRSFGVNYNLKKDEPYYLYDELNINPAMGIIGSDYDRVLIRIDEISKALSLILRIVDSFPAFQNIQEEGNSLPSEEIIMYSYCETANGEINLITCFNPETKKLERLDIQLPTSRTLVSFENNMQYDSILDTMALWTTLGMNEEELVK